MVELVVTPDGTLMMRPPPEWAVDEHVLLVVDMPGTMGLTCAGCEWEEAAKPDPLAGELEWLAQEHWLERRLSKQIEEG